MILGAAICGADPTPTLETRASGCSAGTIELLRDGHADIALVQGAYTYPALTAGDGRDGPRFFGPAAAGIAHLALLGSAIPRLVVLAGSFPVKGAPTETAAS